MSVETVMRDWRFAKAWLSRELKEMARLVVDQRDRVSQRAPCETFVERRAAWSRP